MRLTGFALTSLATGLLATACAATAQDEVTSSIEETAETASALDIVLPQPGASIPMTGTANVDFKPVDDAVRRFMQERCVGGAVVGIGYGNFVLYNRGYGYKNGPPSSGCATAQDPFVGGDKIQPNTPFRIGSNSKAVLAAVVRIELKKALAAKRGAPVTDADIEALKVIDNGEIELVAPRVRTAMLASPDPGDITSEPCTVVNPWPKVTVGQLLSHRSGLPRSGEDTYEELSKIRGLTSTTKLNSQETASGATATAKADLKDARGNNAYFVPAMTLEEYAIAQGNRCFASNPGTQTLYSNSGFGMLGYIVEHVTGKPFNATNGFPITHQWSLVSDFTEEELGFWNGIQLSHAALGAMDANEPRYRHWSSNTYYPTSRDDKRPWCLLSGAGCSFDAWSGGTGRWNWHWQEERVPFYLAGHSVTAGTGLLAAEAPKYLAFMNRYSVSTPYGRDRATFAQTADKEHMGALDGTASWVAQLNDGSLSYRNFSDRPDGTTSYDLGNAPVESCSLPSGINVFFAMNQRSDAKCTEANECVVCENADCSEKTSAYGLYPHVLKEALCKAVWNLPIQ